jgi:hypothetical protein
MPEPDAPTQLPIDPTAFQPMRVVAGRDVKVGFELEPITKATTLDKSRLYNGWPKVRNRHCDYRAAQTSGLLQPNINGGQLTEYLGEMFIKFFGRGYLGGTLSLNFLGSVIPGDVLTARGVVTQRLVEGESVRLFLKLWLENQRGETVLAGTASGFAP